MARKDGKRTLRVQTPWGEFTRTTDHDYRWVGFSGNPCWVAKNPEYWAKQGTVCTCDGTHRGAYWSRTREGVLKSANRYGKETLGVFEVDQ